MGEGQVNLYYSHVSVLRFDWPSKREWFWAALAIGGATIVLLRQQVSTFASVPDFGDPLFSMWRLGWIAHQLPHEPSHLFEANIYYPAARTLAYSDAMLVPGLIAAPALWAGVPVLFVYTTLLLATFVAAGLAMFALARAVTQHLGAAIVAALVFAFDPFRFSHYSHLELQFTCWMPLALLALFRTLSSGRLRDGAATGLFVSLQALSSLYYGAVPYRCRCWSWPPARSGRSGGLPSASGARLALECSSPQSWRCRSPLRTGRIV